MTPISPFPLTFLSLPPPPCTSLPRFANPASLNGATSWVFLNSPENVQHVCATNVRNYGRRYLPDIYEFVTHGKGILGSQVGGRGHWWMAAQALRYAAVPDECTRGVQGLAPPIAVV